MRCGNVYISYIDPYKDAFSKVEPINAFLLNVKIITKDNEFFLIIRKFK